MTPIQHTATEPESGNEIGQDESAVTPEAEGYLSQARTIEMILERSKRKNRTVPIRRAFVQLGERPGTRPGALKSLVASRQERALDLYLLVAAITGANDHSVTEWSTTWARTIGIFDEKTGAPAVSRSWKALKDLGLITTARGSQRRTTVTKRMEDGSGPYAPPENVGEKYLQLPYAYWENDLHTKLSLPGKAMLLIAYAQRKNKFALVQAKISEWYGLAQKTVAAGTDDLVQHGVLEPAGFEYFDSLAVRSGRGSRPLYRLVPPFHQRGLPQKGLEDFFDRKVSEK
ncbi:hypothetical protein [Streptomyces sp. WAC01280]|uniref:hypothetical protein n=1 Tax=Streptomyces sp. WAC01280 TaxID=2487424 RepID=UPI000F78DE96|nr:hypothetical protein [Streptomyces sp. WAC01280]RSS50084.1 hypothetical protein EF909_39245 [Streptomyces sp. WAC01280]